MKVIEFKDKSKITAEDCIKGAQDFLQENEIKTLVLLWEDGDGKLSTSYSHCDSKTLLTLAAFLHDYTLSDMKGGL